MKTILTVTLFVIYTLINGCYMDEEIDWYEGVDTSSFVDSSTDFDSLTTEEPNIDSDMIEWSPRDNDIHTIKNKNRCKWEIALDDLDKYNDLMADRFSKLTFITVKKDGVFVAFGLLFDDFRALMLNVYDDIDDWFYLDATIEHKGDKTYVKVLNGYKRNGFWLLELEKPDNDLGVPNINISSPPEKDTCYTLYDFSGTYQTILFNGELLYEIPEQQILLFNSDWYLVGYVGQDYKFHRLYE